MADSRYTERPPFSDDSDAKRIWRAVNPVVFSSDDIRNESEVPHSELPALSMTFIELRPVLTTVFIFLGINVNSTSDIVNNDEPEHFCKHNS